MGSSRKRRKAHRRPSSNLDSSSSLLVNLLHDPLVCLDADVRDMVALDQVELLLHVDLAHPLESLDQLKVVVKLAGGLLGAELGAEVS